jgi:hypothetical protein
MSGHIRTCPSGHIRIYPDMSGHIHMDNGYPWISGYGHIRTWTYPDISGHVQADISGYIRTCPDISTWTMDIHGHPDMDISGHLDISGHIRTHSTRATYMLSTHSTRMLDHLITPNSSSSSSSACASQKPQRGHPFRPSAGRGCSPGSRPGRRALRLSASAAHSPRAVLPAQSEYGLALVVADVLLPLWLLLPLLAHSRIGIELLLVGELLTGMKMRRQQ